MPDFFSQPRERIAVLPTPLEFMPRLTKKLGGPRIYIKRDDLTGLAFGGNKTRKLEYLLADAKRKGVTHFITEGGAQSNHVRQAAAAARLGGMQAVLVLNSPDDHPPMQGNLLIDDLLGAQCHYVPTGPARKPKMHELAEQIKAEGGVPYVVVSGGSDAVGALGYVGMILEMNSQLVEQSVSPRCIYVANGSAGTQAGMIVGKSLFGGDYTIKGYCVVPGGAEEITQDTLTLANQCAAHIGADPVDASQIICDDTQFGEAYGFPTLAALDAIRLLADTEAILLDPVYSAKAFAGMLADIRDGQYHQEDAIVFVHTGGALALFAKVDLLQPILSRSTPPSITAIELKAMIDRGDDIELIDVREPAEHQIVNLPGSKLIPLKTLPDHLDDLDPDKTHVMICKVGARSAVAVQFLRERDFKATNLTGGILGWVREIDPSLPTY